MPAKSNKLLIHLDLLKPQGNPENIPVKFLRWLFSSGRLLFIFVELVVLTAFIVRFKLDADLASKKEAIDQEISFIKSLNVYEVAIKQTQVKLSTIQSFRFNTTDYSQILKKIADQIPAGIKIITLNMTRNVDKITVSISSEAQSNNDLTSFISGLKDAGFTQVTLSSVGVEQGLIRSVVNADIVQNTGGKNL